MTAMMRVPRSRGAGSGLLLVLLGAWGALIPFVGPYFHFAYTPDTAWTWTWGRFFLEVLPGVAAVLGGLILMASAVRPVAMFGAALATAAGAWFTVGSLLGAVAFGRLAVVGAREAQLAAGEETATWAKPRRAEKAAKQDKPAKPAAEQDGERPSVWRRLTAAR